MSTMATVKKNIPSPAPAKKKVIVASDPTVRRLFALADERAVTDSPKKKAQLEDEFAALLIGN